jgi:cysteine-rich repeat protein
VAALVLTLGCGGGGGGGDASGGVCGNGVREGKEQCDDGNLLNLDGCDAGCRYELFLRMTRLRIQRTQAPDFCTPRTNRLGSQVLGSTAVDQLNSMLQDQLDAGDVNVLVQLLGLQDLAGASDQGGLAAGILGAELDPAKGAWSGASLDWWFLADPAGLDANGLPVAQPGSGTLASGALRLGPSDAELPVSLGGGAATMRLRSMQLSATLDDDPAPDVPAPPPARLAPGLRVVREMTASGTGQGVCGNVTVESLAQIPVPYPLAAGGPLPCLATCPGSRSYAYCGDGQPVGPACNSLLDVIVGGCKVGMVVPCFAAVNAQQPDVAGVAGGTVAALTPGADGKVPDAQTAGNRDGYSAYLGFDATRVHVTGRAP